MFEQVLPSAILLAIGLWFVWQKATAYINSLPEGHAKLWARNTAPYFLGGFGSVLIAGAAIWGLQPHPSEAITSKHLGIALSIDAIEDQLKAEQGRTIDLQDREAKYASIYAEVARARRAHIQVIGDMAWQQQPKSKRPSWAGALVALGIFSVCYSVHMAKEVRRINTRSDQ